MQYSNAMKQEHGQKTQESVKAILNYAKDIGYIKDIITNYQIGKQGCQSKKQFSANFLITFLDDTCWAIFATASHRTDRIKGNQWDAYNLKEINTSITEAYLVYPDSVIESEHNAFIARNQKYIDKEEYSAIDGVKSQEELANLIEEYALKNISVGRAKDIEGKNFEKMIVDIICDSSNFHKWKDESTTSVGKHYGIFKTIISALNIPKDSTTKLSANNDIPRLPSRGFPKTDVKITATDTEGNNTSYTISCKKSSRKDVSVHQYPADTFADVLDKENISLRKLLNKFQEAGGIREFGSENAAMLEKELEPYQGKLFRWVLGGFGGNVAKEWQNADYILTYDSENNGLSIHSINEYYDILKSHNPSGQFGTFFKWTFASKSKGKSIQLKCPIYVSNDSRIRLFDK